MKIVIAPDSFKGSLDAPAVARAIEKGLRRVLPELDCVRVPMADGGEGTVGVVLAARRGRRVRRTVSDPLGAPLGAVFGLLADGTAVIETAAASGLALVPAAQRNPLRTSSHGTGELLKAALDLGVRRVIVGLGGSATVDGGAGALQALGAVFRDGRGRTLSRPLNGGTLARVASVDLEVPAARFAAVELWLACDVRNPLYGPHGAARIFGPQKGATPAQVHLLDANLRHFGELLAQRGGRRTPQSAGGGAAGGLGAALQMACGGRLLPGAEIVAGLIDLERQLDGADLVITGEGRLDAQTAWGKAPAGVARLARARGLPVVGLAGALADDARVLYRHGFAGLVASVTRPQTEAAAMAAVRVNVERAAERIGHWLRLGEILHRLDRSRVAPTKPAGRARRTAG